MTVINVRQVGAMFPWLSSNLPGTLWRRQPTIGHAAAVQQGRAAINQNYDHTRSIQILQCQVHELDEICLPVHSRVWKFGSLLSEWMSLERAPAKKKKRRVSPAAEKTAGHWVTAAPVSMLSVAPPGPLCTSKASLTIFEMSSENNVCARFETSIMPLTNDEITWRNFRSPIAESPSYAD